MPTCSSSGQMGFVKDTKDVTNIDYEKHLEDVPTCEEAMKTRVLVLVDGKYLDTAAFSGADPFISNGRTMLPLRAIADAFGFEVEWEAGTSKITLAKDGRTIVLHIGKPDIVVDGETVYFEDAVPMIKNNRTFLPASKLAEILGIKVEWNGETRTATFST